MVKPSPGASPSGGASLAEVQRLRFAARGQRLLGTSRETATAEEREVPWAPW